MIMEISELGVPKSMARWEMAKSAKPNATYRANIIFLSR